MRSMRFLVGLICLLFSTLSINAFAIPQNQYERMIVLGDSYSDNGNDFSLSLKKYPNAVRYFQGRFSDGPVWAEYFARYFQIDPNTSQQFINLAYGQAKILSPTTITVQGVKEKSYPIPDLSQQIDSYLAKNHKVNDNDLVVLFISTNDFFDMTDINDTAFFRKLADEQARQIDRLIKAGAQHIVVLNGRNLSSAPLTAIFAKNYVQKNGKISEKDWIVGFDRLTQIYNQRLADNLRNKSEVFLYNTHDFDSRTIEKIKAGGLKYTMDNKRYILKNYTEGCYQNNQGDYQGVAGPVCPEPKTHFFYDRIHTTSGVNYLLAKDIYKKFSTFQSQKLK